MIGRVRRHRFGIGLLAAYALLLGALIPAFAVAADPLQAELDAHLCGPGRSQGDQAPAAPSDHPQKCQLCGPSCAMAFQVPLAMPADGAIAFLPRAKDQAVPVRRAAAIPAPLSLYPSNLFSQGPPQAA
ncbi:hypothetical protein [Dongia sp.]|uniref:hypothetical protein n=1 Tax=Dongia sp. TaxID=1977262 RepID=UPI003752FBB5